MLRSDCCDAPIIGEVSGAGEEDACGLCSKCHEQSGMYDDGGPGTTQSYPEADEVLVTSKGVTL